MKIDMTNWANFIVDDLFEIINGKGITVEEIESNPGDFEAVQSGEGNNGVMGSILAKLIAAIRAIHIAKRHA